MWIRFYPIFGGAQLSMYIGGGGGGGVGGQEKGTGRRESGRRRRKEEWGGRPDIGSSRPGLSQRGQPLSS